MLSRELRVERGERREERGERREENAESRMQNAESRERRIESFAGRWCVVQFVWLKISSNNFDFFVALLCEKCIISLIP